MNLKVLCCVILISYFQIQSVKCLPTDLIHDGVPKIVADEISWFNSLQHPRVVGGEESVPHSRPYQAGLVLHLQGYNSSCGASLINRRTALTAAHCVDSESFNGFTGVTVVLGGHSMFQEEVTQQRYFVGLTDIILHPGWNPSNLAHDIAIIRLPEQVIVNQYVRPIPLPRRSQINESYVGNQSLVSGWGYPSDESNAVSPILREVSQPIISNAACNIAYMGFIQPYHICMSGAYGRGSCFGDSGGPLTVNGVQIGVVSFGGYFGCETGWPPGFIRVTYYLDWIAETAIADDLLYPIN